MRTFKIWLITSFSIVVTFVGTSQAMANNTSLVQDSMRRKTLSRSVEVWAERFARPVFNSVLDRVDKIAVRVIEPEVTLPPDLGGPRPGSVMRIQVELSARGYGADHFGHSYDRYGYGHSAYRVLDCFIDQPLMARVGADGKPVRLVENQRVTTPVGCGTNVYRKRPGNYVR